MITKKMIIKKERREKESDHLSIMMKKGVHGAAF